jgi:tetratricopeptide (TPR) repeat protein
LERAARLAPNDLASSFNYGSCLYALDRIPEATPWLEAARALAPRDGDVLLLLVRAYSRSRDLMGMLRAAELLPEAIQANNESGAKVDELLDLGELFLRVLWQDLLRESGKGAEEQVRAARAMSIVSQIRDHYRLADALGIPVASPGGLGGGALDDTSRLLIAASEFVAASRYREAIDLYSKAISGDPDNALAYECRAQTWVDLKEYDAAIADYTKSLALHPAGMTYNNRGTAWVMKKEYAKAIADFREAIRLDDGLSLPHKNCAWLLATCPEAACRDAKSAVRLAQRACKLTKWKDANCIMVLGAAFAEAGDFAQALELHRRARAFPEFEQQTSGQARAVLASYERGRPWRQE